MAPPACASGDVEACFQRSLADGTRAAPVAAIEALLGVIERSGAQTMHGLQDELCEGRKALVEFCEQRPACLGGRTELGVSSGCELFLRHVTRTFLEFGDFSECRDEILRRGRAFAAHDLVGVLLNVRRRPAALGGWLPVGRHWLALRRELVVGSGPELQPRWLDCDSMHPAPVPVGGDDEATARAARALRDEGGHCFLVRQESSS